MPQDPGGPDHHGEDAQLLVTRCAGARAHLGHVQGHQAPGGGPGPGDAAVPDHTQTPPSGPTSPSREPGLPELAAAGPGSLSVI